MSITPGSGICCRLDVSNMNDDSNNIVISINIMPKYGYCYDFLKDVYSGRKTIWLVPHVIKYREESQVIIWRCNWGNVCKSDCIYAMAKERNELVHTDLRVNNRASH